MSIDLLHLDWIALTIGTIGTMLWAHNGKSAKYALDWIALTIGTIGTMLWAHNGKSAKYAAVFWLISSLVWMTFAYFKGLPALGIRDLISVCLYIYGGYRWLVRKQEN